MQPLSLYLHIPFCHHRCGYCDFNTYAGLNSIIPQYVAALAAEIAWTGEWNIDHLPLHTIYFGGGTPSLVPIPLINQILEQVDRSYTIASKVEITLEANPGTLSPEYLQDLRALGVNRLSIGMQSAHPGELVLLEREHTYLDVINSLTWARKTGFTNINLDLIYALPDQPLQSWMRNLELALGLQPDHLSLYSLTIEHGTPFGAWSKKGLISQPDPDLAADMYEWAVEQLEGSGYVHYEISNWEHSDSPISPQLPLQHACRHNLQYWRNQPYIGCGAGAHGYFRGWRTANVLSPITYIQRMKGKDHITTDENSSAAAVSVVQIDQKTEMDETMLMGLRLLQEGISKQEFLKRFGSPLEEVYQPQIARLLKLGLIEWTNPDFEVLRLAKKAVFLSNQVFIEFIG